MSVPNEITRATTAPTAVIAINTATSGVVTMGRFAGGLVIVPAAWTAANIGFQVSHDNTTFVILRDRYGAAVEITSVKTDGTRAYALPEELFAATYFKLWSKNTASEADVNQGAARTLTLQFKG